MVIPRHQLAALATRSLLAIAAVLLLCQCETKRTYGEIRRGSVKFDQAMWGGQGDNDAGEIRSKFAEKGYSIGRTARSLPTTRIFLPGRKPKASTANSERKRRNLKTTLPGPRNSGLRNTSSDRSSPVSKPRGNPVSAPAKGTPIPHRTNRPGSSFSGPIVSSPTSWPHSRPEPQADPTNAFPPPPMRWALKQLPPLRVPPGCVRPPDTAPMPE